jgi:hypothetical protein
MSFSPIIAQEIRAEVEELIEMMSNGEQYLRQKIGGWKGFRVV